MRALCLTLLAFFGSLEAIDRRPWFGRDKEFEFTSSVSHQWKEPAQFADFNLAISPIDNVHCEAELGLWSEDIFESFSLGGAYRWLNDVARHPLSLTTGAVFTFSSSDDNIRVFHHSDYEVEFYIALGKEIADGRYWSYRFWTAASLGLPHDSSIWSRLECGIEKNWLDCHRLGFFAVGRTGDRKVSSFPVEASYHFVDLSLRYGYLFLPTGGIYLGFTERVAGDRVIKPQHRLTIEYSHPFSL